MSQTEKQITRRRVWSLYFLFKLERLASLLRRYTAQPPRNQCQPCHRRAISVCINPVHANVKIYSLLRERLCRHSFRAWVFPDIRVPAG